jgi:hypothetical protein
LVCVRRTRPRLACSALSKGAVARTSWRGARVALPCGLCMCRSVLVALVSTAMVRWCVSYACSLCRWLSLPPSGGALPIRDLFCTLPLMIGNAAAVPPVLAASPSASISMSRHRFLKFECARTVICVCAMCARVRVRMCSALLSSHFTHAEPKAAYIYIREPDSTK